MQIRCGHIPLNVYLHKIKSETNRCQECIDNQGKNFSIETINHFLFDCPACEEAWEELIDKIGRSCFHLSDIMAVKSAGLS